ncbi:HNH endonuclease family protein [Streptomyces sp. NPDC005322]|uniref:HNH endonuclease family protein n=1 Tax=Streptomyces sp. NPDC005322 TaxID=3157032 RepID=UPI0033B725BE
MGRLQGRFRIPGRGFSVALAALLAVTGCQPGGKGEHGSGEGRPSGPALAAVSSLTVKGRAPRTGYERSEFGSSWVDTDDNGCGTRDDILKRDLAGARFRDGHCLVTSGTLTDDPYTGRSVRFVRGHSKVDIDHVVALSDAWQKGAQKWDRDKRVAFANDPLNLIAVDASANRGKGDGDAATWLPPHKAYRCDYVAHQVAVKKKYGVWVTRAEKDAMRRVLGRCPKTELPARSGAPQAR